MSLVITDAGIAAATKAKELGIEYKITHISIGSEGYTPSKSQTALKAEILKRALTRGDVIAPGRLHFETIWDGDEEFVGKELGYWLEDGTLFAVDSREGAVITYKHKTSVVTEGCELNLSASSIENITVELIGTPEATESVAGIAKIATAAMVDAGTDDRSFLTVKKLVYALGLPYIRDKLVELLWEPLLEKMWIKVAFAGCPVGSPLSWPTDTAPDGFAIMKGQAFDVVANPNTAKAYPSGVLPDMRGLAIVGKKDGELILAYEEDAVKSHNHSGSVSSTDLGSKIAEEAGSHAHGLPNGKDANATSSTNALQGASTFSNWNRTSSSSGEHIHAVPIGSHVHELLIAAFGATENTIKNRKFNWIVRMA
ncbi:phage tail protein [Vibrio furnissii]|uniref:phage tail protein n=1 Tax=Vibrio furnissii TaxID=29494 RepID=UPI001558F762|nr:phage tail protein [Vibrio furnissii]